MKKYTIKLVLFALLMVSSLSVLASEPVYIKLIEPDINTTTYDSSFFNTNTSLSPYPYVDDEKGIVLSSGIDGMASSLFLKEKMSRASDSNPGFSTYFQLNIYRGNSSHAADGIVFIVAAKTNSIGQLGGGLGYQGIDDSVGIEFDFYNNAAAYNTNVPHIDISTNGNLKSDSSGFGLFDSSFNSNYAAASVNTLVRNYHVWIDWNELNSTLEIRVNTSNNTRPEAATHSQTNLNLDVLNDTYFAGFTAATGGMNVISSVKQWYFANEYLETGIDVNAINFEVDSTPPSTPSFNFDNETSALSIENVTDQGSGVYQVQYSFNNVDYLVYDTPLMVKESTTIYARAIDNAGNISTTQTIDFYELKYLEEDVYQKLYAPEDYNLSLPSNIKSPLGYSFEGFSNSDVTNRLIENIQLSQDTEIFPVFTPIDYTITYNQTLGAIQSPLTSPYTLEISLPILSEPGYTFDGWMDENNDFVNYETMPRGNKTLTAVFTPLDYLVTFKTNLGSTPSSIVAPYLNEINLPLLLEPGYIFDGWMNEEVLLTDSFAMPLSGASLTAVFTPLDYTITYNQTLGAIQSPLTKAYTSQIALPVLSEPGYTFEGWVDENNDFVNYETMPLGDKTLTAVFTPLDYTITYNQTLGAIQSPLISPYTSNISLPVLSEPGYTFDGWMDENNDFVDYETVPLGDKTLTAVFTPINYTILFKTDLGTTPSSITAAYLEKVKLPSLFVSGYTFDGWMDGEVLLTDSFIMPISGASFVAFFTPLDYTITYNQTLGAIQSPLTSPYTLEISLPILSEPGYTFDGWMDENNNFVSYETMPLGDKTLTAVFTPIDYTITYNQTLGAIQSPLISPYTLEISLPILSEPGYTFDGWMDENNDFVNYKTMPLGDKSLTAVFTPIIYDIHLKSTTHLQNTLITSAYLSVVSLPSITLEGHTFMGWDTGNERVTESFIVMPLYGVTLSAVFEVNNYNLSFATYTEDFFSPESLDYMEELNLPTPERIGYTFVGWYEGSGYFKASRMPSRDVLLKAQWELNTYTVTLMVDDSIYDTLNVVYNETIDLPVLEKTGYIFNGWLENSEENSYSLMPDKDITLVADFSLDLVTVSYVVDGVKTELSVNFGESYLPRFPEKTGYIFDTWLVDGNPVDDVLIDRPDIEFEARFYPARTIQRITTPFGTVELNLQTNQEITGFSQLNLTDGYRFVGYFTQPFGSGERITDDYLIKDASTTILYPYYTSSSTATSDLSTLLSLNGRAYHQEPVVEHYPMPWLQIVGFTLTSSFIVYLYVSSKERKHG